MQVKNNMCKEYRIIFHVLKWLYISIVSIMICKTLTNTTFCDNQFNFNNCFIIELKLLAIKKIVFVRLAYSVAVSDLEPGGRGSFVLLALPAFLPSEFFSFFTLNGGRGRLPGPSLVLHAIDQ